MTDPLTRECLSQLLINIARSLLQYCGESWPWTDPRAKAHRDDVQEMVLAQQEDVRALIRLMQARHMLIDLGSYPDYSGLHYASLDYFLRLLGENQAEVVKQIDQARAICLPDTEATELLITIHKRESDYLRRIKELSAQPAAR